LVEHVLAELHFKLVATNWRKQLNCSSLHLCANLMFLLKAFRLFFLCECHIGDLQWVFSAVLSIRRFIEYELDSSSILTGFDDLPQSPFRLRSLLKLWGSEFGGLQSMFYGFHDVLIHEHFGVKIEIMYIYI